MAASGVLLQPALLLGERRVHAARDDARQDGAAGLSVRNQRLDLLRQVHHLDGGRHSIEALVAGFGAGPLDGLLDRIGGQHAVDDGDAALHADVGDALDGFVGDHVEVRGVAADHGAQADDGVEFLGGGHLLGDERNFESARHPGEGQVVGVAAVADERVFCAAEQFARDEFIETGCDDADLEAVRDEVSFDGFHGCNLLSFVFICSVHPYEICHFL